MCAQRSARLTPISGASSISSAKALRRDLGLDLLDRLWAANDLDEDEARALATEAQHRTRR